MTPEKNRSRLFFSRRQDCPVEFEWPPYCAKSNSGVSKKLYASPKTRAAGLHIGTENRNQFASFCIMVIAAICADLPILKYLNRNT